jgi:hypothetical protein
MERAPTMMSILANLMPAKKKDMGSVAVCSDGCSCDSFPVHDVPAHTNQPNVVTCGICDDDSEDGSVMSDIHESKDEVTPKECDIFLASLPLKLMPQSKSHIEDCIHHTIFSEQYKRDITTFMEIMCMPRLGTWEMCKHAVVERLHLLHSYENAYENKEILFDNELMATVKRKMNGEKMDWHALLDMCMFTSEIEIGTYNDPKLKRMYRTNHTKLLSTMEVQGLNQATAHWEERRCDVYDGLRLLHNFKHVMYVVVYGDNYVAGQTVSRVENCIPGLLHCKKCVIDKVIRMLLFKAQEKSTKKSKAAALRRVS